MSADDRCWKALADPSRRRILDLLRERPRSTGELADAFEFTRFAAMKHLKVLHEAGLVLYERRGRTRINRLNPVPIRRIHRRWIRPFETAASDRMLRLERHLTTERRDAMTLERPLDRPLDPAKIGDLVVETVIDTTPEAAWRALTDDVAAWWPEEFYTGGDPRGRRFVLEPSPGGRMYEDWGEDGGLLWGTVLTVEKNRALEVVGHTSPRWGGPNTWVGVWTLEPTPEPDPGGVRLRFRESAFGRVDEAYTAEKDKGWRFLFDGALKAHLEGTDPPAWDDWE